MSDVVVKAEGVGKRYQVKAPGEGGYVALRDVLAQGAHALLDALRGRTRPPDEAEAFWALREVDFEIRRGEVVGLIGRNGAGKSTLLKLLSRITEPTEGRITIRAGSRACSRSAPASIRNSPAGRTSSSTGRSSG